MAISGSAAKDVTREKQSLGSSLPESLWPCWGTTPSAVRLPAFYLYFRNYSQNKVRCNFSDLFGGKGPNRAQLAHMNSPCWPEWDDFLMESLCCCLVI